MPPFFVLTGGPGAGKTTLIEALRGAGFAGTEEAGRGVIRAQAAIGGPALPGSNPALFAEAMLVWELRNHAEAERANAPTFFDRGLPDIAGYLTLTGLPVPAHVGRAIRSFRYSPVVFCLPPWPEIFVGDRERTQDLPEAVRTYEVVTEAYADAGYRLVEVPPATVDERLRFVLSARGLA